MIGSVALVAVLDANVLYPAPLRDYLLYLADLETYKPKWSPTIQEEWIRNLLLNRPDLKRKNLEQTREAMDAAFPDANITNYQQIIKGLSLPDTNDRHVLAAAIKANADVIVTFNLKDFPVAYLNLFDISVQHPDDFISHLVNTDTLKSLQALENQVTNLKNPPQTRISVLETLENCGLVNSVAMLKK